MFFFFNYNRKGCRETRAYPLICSWLKKQKSSSRRGLLESKLPFSGGGQ